MADAKQPHLRNHDAAGLTVSDLGRISYAEAYAEQRRLQQALIDGRGVSGGALGHLLLLEHDPPVITVSKRPEAAKHLLATPELLASQGIEVAQTDRGGDITYHGPGQLVAYVILDLNRLKLNLRSYMRWLEQIVIDTLAEFDIAGDRDDCATGVWVQKKVSDTFSEKKVSDTFSGAAGCGGLPTAKICAMGVRVSRWVSMHGLALNVAPNLDHFRLIVPCGLAGRAVTSMQQQLGADCPDLATVKSALAEQALAAVCERLGD
jgi:lipoyl(octanoyl) transferase